jgi:hypothetical protein
LEEWLRCSGSSFAVRSSFATAPRFRAAPPTEVSLHGRWHESLTIYQISSDVVTLIALPTELT